MLLLENSIYTNEEEKELFLKDKVLIADAFYINVIGFLSLYSISHKRGRIKTYMSDQQVALANIADESNDLLVSLKAYHHIGGIRTDTANKLMRLLAKIKTQTITNKDLDENIIRGFVEDCKLDIHRPTPLIYTITKQFIDGDSLINIAKDYYRVIKSNKKIKGVSKELFKIMYRYIDDFKKQGYTTGEEDSGVDADTQYSAVNNYIDSPIRRIKFSKPRIKTIDPNTHLTIDPKDVLDPKEAKEVLRVALNGEINLNHVDSVTIDSIIAYLRYTYDIRRDHDLLLNSKQPYELSFDSLNIPDKIVDCIADVLATANQKLVQLSDFTHIGLAVVKYGNYPEVEKNLKTIIDPKEFQFGVSPDTRGIQDLYTLDDVVNFITRLSTEESAQSSVIFDFWVEKYGIMLLNLISERAGFDKLIPLISVLPKELRDTLDLTEFTKNIDKQEFLAYIQEAHEHRQLDSGVISEMAEISVSLFTIDELVDFILTKNKWEIRAYQGYLYDLKYNLNRKSSKQGDIFIDTMLERVFVSGMEVVTVIPHMIQSTFNFTASIARVRPEVQLKIFEIILHGDRIIDDYSQAAEKGRITINHLSEPVITEIIKMMSIYLKTNFFEDGVVNYKRNYTLDESLEILYQITGKDYFRQLTDATFSKNDRAGLDLSDYINQHIFLKISTDKEMSNTLAKYKYYDDYIKELGQHITLKTIDRLTTKSAINLMKNMNRWHNNNNYNTAWYDDQTFINLMKNMNRGFDGDSNNYNTAWVDDLTLFTNKVISEYVFSGNVDQSVIAQLYNEYEHIRNSIVDKLAQTHALIETNNQIMADENPIKPYEKLTHDRLLEILTYNNIDLTSHGIEITHDRILDVLSYTNVDLTPHGIEITRDDLFDDVESLIKDKVKQMKILDDVKVKEIEQDDFDLDTITLEYDKFNNRAHGNIAIKFLRSFNVDIPLMYKEYDKFLAMFDGKLDAYHANYTAPQFHGTGSIAAAMILRYGFAVISSGDPATTGRMLGDGIYVTNVMDKCSQYIGDRGYVAGKNNIKNTGYILECEVLLGKQGVGRHHIVGTEMYNIVSPEWVVFYPNMQIKIKKAHEVEIIPADYIDDLKNKRGIMESNIKPFKQFLFEGKTGNKEALTYIFRDGNIPVSEDEYVKFEDFKASAYGDNVKLDYTGSGPAVIIYNDKKTHTMVVPMITHFMRDHKLMDEYLSYLNDN